MKWLITTMFSPNSQQPRPWRNFISESRANLSCSKWEPSVVGFKKTLEVHKDTLCCFWPKKPDENQSTVAVKWIEAGVGGFNWTLLSLARKRQWRSCQMILKMNKQTHKLNTLGPPREVFLWKNEILYQFCVGWMIQSPSDTYTSQISMMLAG